MDKKMVYRPDLAEDATEFCPLCGAPVAPEEKSEPEAIPAQPETAPRTVTSWSGNSRRAASDAE